MDRETQVPLVDSPRRQRRATLPKRISVTVDETCKITGLGRTKVYELIGQHKLKAVAIGRRRLVIYDSIEKLINQV
jgi:excisionase family DNA binding protein